MAVPEKGIVSVHLMDGMSRTISVTNRTTVANVVELLLQKFPGLSPDDHIMLVVGKVVPIASAVAVTEVGTTLAGSDHLLDIQLSWGARNVNNNRFKLVHKHSLVKIQFKNIPEVEDGTFGGIHCGTTMNADVLCEVVALDYGLNRKRKYQLVDSLDQSTEDRVVSKDEKPLTVQAQTIKSFNVPPDHYYFTIMPKQDNWFVKAKSQASRLLGVKQEDSSSKDSIRVLPKRVSVGVPVLMAATAETEEEIPMPPEEELNKQFLQLMSELNIKDDVRTRMLNDDPKRKWKLICQHRMDAGTDKNQLERKDPVQYIENIQKKSTQLKTLTSLRVELNNAPVSWIQQFLDSQGLVAIQAVLQKIFDRRQHKLETDEDVQLEGLRCVRGIMNTEPGLRQVLATPAIVHNIAYCLTGLNEKLPMLTQELMAALCILSPRGHALVLESLGIYATAFEEQFRFQTILEYIVNRKNHSFELQTMAISLVNAIVNAPENISVRIKLREELQRRGFNQILQAIRYNAPADLITQINVYAEESEADAADASNVLQSKGYDLNNPMDVATEVVKRVVTAANSQVAQHLLSTLQNLMLLNPEGAGVREWFVVDVFAQKLAQLQGLSNAAAWTAVWQDFLRAVEDSTGLKMTPSDTGNNQTSIEAELATLKNRLQEKDTTIVSLSTQLERLKLDLAEAMEHHKGGDSSTGYLQTISDLNNKIGELEELLAHAQTDAQKFYQTQINLLLAQHQSEVADVVERLEQLKQQHDAEVRDILNQAEASPAALLEAQNEVKHLQELLQSGDDARSSQLQQQLAQAMARQEQLEKDKTELLTKLGAQKEASDRADQAEIEGLRNEVSILRRQLQAAQKSSARMSLLMSPTALDSILQNEGAPPPPGASMEPFDVEGASGDQLPPPPPPPPPGLDAPPPPPPPGMGPVGPTKKPIKPKVPLKQFNWTKIPNIKVSETIWKTISDENVKVNTAELESLFAKQQTQPTAATATNKVSDGAAGATAAPTSKKPTTVTLLEMNRANNIAIMLARLKMPNSEIRDAILRLDESKLSVDVLRMLRQFVPTEEEIEIVREYDGDVSQLGNAEKYFREIADIPKFGARINAMLFVRRFATSVEEVKPDIETVKKATGEIKHSRKLMQILQVCLAIGNYLNGSTFRGEAFGFRLEALGKLSETKAADGVTTLLHYLVRMLEQEDASLLDFLDTMPSVDAAGRLPLPSIIGVVKELKSGLAEIETLLKTTKEQTNAGDELVTVIQQFLDDSQITLQALLKETDEMEREYKQLLQSFGEEDTTQPEDFFPILVRFSQDLKRARKENAAPKMAIGAAAAAAVVPGAPPGATKLPGMPVLEKGELDNALKGLREGNAFRRKRENRRSQVYSGEQTLPSDALVAAEKLKKTPPAVAKKPLAS